MIRSHVASSCLNMSPYGTGGPNPEQDQVLGQVQILDQVLDHHSTGQPQPQSQPQPQPQPAAAGLWLWLWGFSVSPANPPVAMYASW